MRQQQQQQQRVLYNYTLDLASSVSPIRVIELQWSLCRAEGPTNGEFLHFITSIRPHVHSLVLPPPSLSHLSIGAASSAQQMFSDKYGTTGEWRVFQGRYKKK